VDELFSGWKLPAQKWWTTEKQISLHNSYLGSLVVLGSCWGPARVCVRFHRLQCCSGMATPYISLILFTVRLFPYLEYTSTALSYFCFWVKFWVWASIMRSSISRGSGISFQNHSFFIFVSYSSLYIKSYLFSLTSLLKMFDPYSPTSSSSPTQSQPISNASICSDSKFSKFCWSTTRTACASAFPFCLW
jgi:hypothetical protein